MITIIVMYKLKKDTKVEDYKKYSLTQDQPLLNSFKEIEDFAVHLMEGPSKEIDVFEVIKIDSWNSWNILMENERMKENLKTWETICDKDSVKIYYGSRIV